MTDVVLHIGLHKTATGTLQRQYFPACENLNLLTTKVPEMREFVAMVTRTDPIYFDPGAAKALLEPVCEPEITNMLSNESFSGPPYAGVVEKGLDHRSSVLQNLSAVFPDARVILVLRRQDGLVRSFYRQYLKSGGTETVRRFFGVGTREQQPLLSPNRFRFLPYIDALNNYFKNGVLVLMFEEFVKEQEIFMKRLVEFIGVQAPNIQLRVENATRMGAAGMEFTRLLNYVFRGMINRGPLPGLPVYKEGQWRSLSPVRLLHDHWPQFGKGTHGATIQQAAQEILAGLSEENRALDAKYDLGLKRFDYY